jgi:hypothetical protein
MKERFYLSIDNLNIGGAQEQIKLLEYYLKSLNYEVKFLICYPNSYIQRDVRFIFFLMVFYNLKYFLKILKCLFFARPSDRFISFLSKSNFFFFLSSLVCSFNNIYYSFRNDKILWNYKDYIILNFGKVKQLKFTTNNKLYFRYFRRNGLISFYTPNLIISNPYSEKNIDFHAINFISVCRCMPTKRIIEMLDFLFYISKISDKKINYDLYLRSENLDYEKLVINKIKFILDNSSKISINIHFNERSNYNKSDILLHFSDVESSPNVVLESISHYIYPIVADIPAYSHLSDLLVKDFIIKEFNYRQYQLIYQKLAVIQNYNFERIIYRIKHENEFYYKILLNA